MTIALDGTPQCLKLYKIKMSQSGTCDHRITITNEDSNKRKNVTKREFNVNEQKMNFSVHTTKTRKRERVGADDIYHEDFGRRTPQ
jgi:ribosomal protein L28